ncbi:protein BEAN1-like isoform X1 [Acipenser ruthenus]|uniref:protein BEAN1-like isoform X1 n=1 Tax=Acipenser ruthenus TaxID=7906 RepID=UPI00274244AB|nr:protein BEAN1-like isoform X1 [Acipenser ruthenus]
MEIIFYLCSALFLHIPPVAGSSFRIGVGSNYSSAYEKNILPCRKEELQCGKGLCLVNWLICHYKKDCGRELMSIKLICSEVSSNQSGPVNEYPNYREGGSDASLLVSPLVVAGIVIGLVLFLSCVTIIIGSLRKDSRLHNPHLRTEANYAPDGFSYGSSIGELRSACIEESPPAFDFDSYVEMLSQVNVMYPDSPPHYEECVGPGATQIYIPTDDPPPYSLNDPCQEIETQPPHTCLEMEELTEEASWVTGSASRYPIILQEIRQQAISSISLPLEEAPPYEVVISNQNLPLPMIPLDLLKHTAPKYHHQQPTIHRIL